MTPRLSVIVPAHNEERFIVPCLRSIRAAERRLAAPVELVVVLNRCTDRTAELARDHGAALVTEDARNMARIRNAGVRASHGDGVITLDADSRMSDNMLLEVMRRLATGRYAGGGARIKLERTSPGIFMSCLTFAPRLLAERCWAGLFWLPRTTFEAVGGFNEELVSAEDVDFARRVRRWGLARGLRYGLILRACIVTSCRKFDEFGDWHLLRNRQLVARILTGRDRTAADHYYYDRREAPARSRQGTCADFGEPGGRSKAAAHEEDTDQLVAAAGARCMRPISREG
jgi:glycosyltransferase involved in cell wall biosynthesis